MILGFEAEEVESVLPQLSSAEVRMPVTNMPWGTTSALLQDPDGNRVNLFSAPEQLRQMAAR